jgi:hypothetical protein
LLKPDSIYKWMEEQSAKPTQANDASNFLRKQIEGLLAKLNESLEAKGNLKAAVLTSRGQKNSLLQIVYSSFEKSIDDVPVIKQANLRIGKRESDSLYFFCTESIPANSSRDSWKVPEEHVDRQSLVRKFHNIFCQETPKKNLTLKGHTLWSIVCGNAIGKTSDQISNVLFLSFSSSASIFDLTKFKEENESIIKNFLVGLELIRKIDSILFRNEAYRLSSHLGHTFLDRDVAPADKMAYSLQVIEKLVYRHLVAGKGSDDSEYLIKVTYVETTFELRGDESVPHFQVYPPEDARDSAIGAFLIADKETPAVVKYALHRYFERTNVYVNDLESDQGPDAKPLKLNADFCGLFSQFDEDLKAKIRNEFSADELLLSRWSAGDAWGHLNLAYDDIEYPSIMTFVIEGAPTKYVSKTSKPQRRLPKGVMVVEGRREGLFLPDHLKGVGGIASSLGMLLRTRHHANSPISYQLKMAEAFEKDANYPGVHARTMGKVLFHVLRLDGEALEKISKSQRLREKSLLIPKSNEFEELVKLLKIIAPGKSDKDVETDSYEALSMLFSNRKKKFFKHVQNLQRACEAVGFMLVDRYLAAIPSNYVWRAYMGAAAHVLSVRSRGAKANFEKITPGFSADTMVLASIDGELKSIIKFSSLNKLHREYRNYEQHVRHKLTFAARIPENSIYFDSKGHRGRCLAKDSVEISPNAGPNWSLEDESTSKFQNKAGTSYGALGSEFVDGSSGGDRSKIATLLTQLSSCLLGEPRPNGTYVVRGELINQLGAFFSEGLLFWRDSTRADLFDDLLKANQSRDFHMTFAKSILAGFHYDAGNTGSDVLLKSVLDGDSSSKAKEKLAQLDSIFEVLDLYAKHESFGKAPRKNAANRHVIEFKSNVQTIFKHIPGITFEPSKINREKAVLTIGIQHGDLNSRNLAWSEAFAKYFAIDFEFTNYGFVETDKWRLVFSLLTDVLSEALWFDGSDGSKGEYDKAMQCILVELANAIGCIKQLIQFLFTNEALNKEEFLCKYLESEYSPSPKDGFLLSEVVLKILEPYPSKTSTSNSATNWANNLKKALNVEPGAMQMAAMPLTAACREFEYSFRDADSAQLQSVLSSLKQARLENPVAILKIIPKVLSWLAESNSSRSYHDIRCISRFLVSLVLLLQTSTDLMPIVKKTIRDIEKKI